MISMAESNREVTQIDLHDALRTIETLPGLRATRKEWNIRCGVGFSFIELLLQPIGGIAECMPCDSSCLGLHYHDVVELSNGTCMAVYSDEDYDCPSFPVERWESAILSPDIDILAGKICNALGLDHRTQERPGGIAIDSHPVIEIGRYHPLESYKFPVVISFHPDVVRTEEALILCLSIFDGPFIFLTSTPKNAFKRVGPIISKRSILVSSLTECISVSDDMTLSATFHWHKCISHFRNKSVPKSEPVMAFFETPANSLWESVYIRFIDGYTVQVEVAGVRDRFSYTEMGMANRRESKPSKQWEFLEMIADNHGFIDFQMGNPDKNKNWKYELSTDLRNFFHINDDPFHLYDESSHSWKAKFTILPIKSN